MQFQWLWRKLLNELPFFFFVFVPFARGFIHFSPGVTMDFYTALTLTRFNIWILVSRYKVFCIQNITFILMVSHPFEQVTPFCYSFRRCSSVNVLTFRFTIVAITRTISQAVIFRNFVFPVFCLGVSASVVLLSSLFRSSKCVLSWCVLPWQTTNP